MRETKNANRMSNRRWLRIAPSSLPAERDVVRVDDDEQIQQAGDDEKGVAVLVRHRTHVAGAVAERLREKIRRAHAEVRQRFETDQRIGEIEWKQPSAQCETNREHQ